MHTYDALSGVTVTPEMDRCAGSMVLIHSMPYIRKLLSEVLERKALSPCGGRRSAHTAQSEKELGERPGVYFYAGRVFPHGVGTVVFMLPASLQPDRLADARACPFDSGGVLQGRSSLPWQQFEDTAGEYVNSHKVDIGQFRDYLGRHLSSFFESPENYWEAPDRGIDGLDHGRADIRKHWRDWTFEIAAFAEVPLSKMKMYVSLDANNFLAEKERNAVQSEWIDIDTADNPSEKAEREARKIALTTEGGKDR